MDTLILRDGLFLEHDPGPGHPENAARLKAVLDDLDARPIPGTRTVAPEPAALEQLLAVHRAAYLDRLADTAGRPRVVLDPDTVTSPRSWEAAQLAAGAVVQGVDAVARGESQGAFALVRPPGHHAERDHAMGFCLVNNVAVGAAHAVDACGCSRVLVLDPDVHHGNGTQAMFYDRDDVLYVSSHRYPFYPGTGGPAEIGVDAGRGFTVNLPLPARSGNADLLHLYTEVVGPIVESWHPELILVSAGYDTWERDPLGGLAVTGRGFAALSALFRRWSDTHCPGRLVWTLEGGYDPAGVVAGVRAALQATTGASPELLAAYDHAGEAAHVVANRVREKLAPFWPALRD